MFMIKRQGDWNNVSIRLSSYASGNTINEIDKVLKIFTANDPIQFNYTDKDFEQMFKAKKQSANFVVLFTLVVIFIALLGLFGLTSFTIEQCTKEIGNRKAMGASIPSLCILITKDFFYIRISTLIVWPFVYYIFQRIGCKTKTIEYHFLFMISFWFYYFYYNSFDND